MSDATEARVVGPRPVHHHYDDDPGPPEPPATLAGLLRLGIEDSRAADRELVRPCAFSWVTPSPDGQSCTACLAGMVMLGTLRWQGHGGPDLAAPSVRWRQALYALDHLRHPTLDGLRGAMEYLEGRVLTLEEEEELIAWLRGADPGLVCWEGWRKYDAVLAQLDSLADLLEAMGL